MGSLWKKLGKEAEEESAGVYDFWGGDRQRKVTSFLGRENIGASRITNCWIFLPLCQ